jgi:hypothetical protein
VIFEQVGFSPRLRSKNDPSKNDMILKADGGKTRRTTNWKIKKTASSPPAAVWLQYYLKRSNELL